MLRQNTLNRCSLGIFERPAKLQSDLKLNFLRSQRQHFTMYWNISTLISSKSWSKIWYAKAENTKKRISSLFFVLASRFTERGRSALDAIAQESLCQANYQSCRYRNSGGLLTTCRDVQFHSIAGVLRGLHRNVPGGDDGGGGSQGILAREWSIRGFVEGEDKGQAGFMNGRRKVMAREGVGDLSLFLL